MVRKILLADDSITIQKVVNLTFSDEGIEVIAVGNGETAVRKMNEIRPDIVLADVYMPGKSGYEVCEFVKTNPQFAHIPVLLLVGAFEPFDPSEAARVKADGHLTKPFESRALVATVSRLLSAAPPPPMAFATPPMAAPVPQSWPSIPPDATTTKLSPDLAEKFQANFANDHKKPEPFKASPVFPVQASPVFPVQASPVFFEENPISKDVSSQETLSISSPSKNSPVASFVDNVFSFDENNFSNPLTSNPEIASDKVETPIDRGPVFDLDAPPAPEPTFELDLNDISYNTSEQKVDTGESVIKAESEKGFDLNEPSFDLNVEPNPSAQPEVVEESQDEQYEATQIMGSASRRELQEAYAAYSKSSTEESEPIDSQDSSTEIQYDDFTPLELEPLDEASYPPHSQNVSTEELPSISDEFVLESKTAEIKKEPLLDIEEPPMSLDPTYQDVTPPLPTIAYPPVSVPSYSDLDYSNQEILSVARTTGAHGNSRVTETMAQLPEPESFSPEANIETEDVLELEDNMPVSDSYLPSVEHTEPNSFEVEQASSHFDVEEPPSQLEIEQAPQYYLDNESAYSDDPLADLVSAPEPESQPQYVSESYQAGNQGYVEPLAQEVYQYQHQPEPQENHFSNEALEELPSIPPVAPLNEELEELPTMSELPMMPSPPSIPNMVALPPIPQVTQMPQMPQVTQMPTNEILGELPLAPVVPIATGLVGLATVGSQSATKDLVSPQEALPVRNIRTADLPTLPSIPALIEAPPTLEVPALSPPSLIAPSVAITSIDQIPQHLVDEIVRRVIAQLSENVVREIAWEVIPDLAQIMIKKHLSQSSGK